MSSNLEIAKACTFCLKDFIAKKTTTRYCSHDCNRKHYKQIKRLEKVQAAGKIVTSIKEPSVAHGKDISIPEAARLLGVTDRTIFRLIAKRIIKPIRSGRNVKISTNELLKRKVYEYYY